MKYNHLKSMLTNEYTAELEKIKGYLNNEDVLKRSLTPARLAKYETGQIDRQTAVEYAFKRKSREREKVYNIKLAMLQNAENAPTIKNVSISISWTRSRTWGYNPTATATIETTNDVKRYTGSASGCGYDKESAAIAQALNCSISIKKMLYDCKENAIVGGKTYNNNSDMNDTFISYGAGYGTLPYFEGGVGVSSHINVFKACGLSLITSNHTKTSDYYYFERR